MPKSKSIGCSVLLGLLLSSCAQATHSRENNLKLPFADHPLTTTSLKQEDGSMIYRLQR